MQTTAFEPRKYMEMAIEVMNKSVQEPRSDKVSPKVGALLMKPTSEIETAFRGELRQGDHAEFTLLERKNRNVALDGSFLFATLEPCAPGARKSPKLSCAERIVNARIKKVWVGIEDPDPSVDRKGIQYLINNGIEVEMFDPDLQDVIREANKQFIKGAEERAKQLQSEPVHTVLTQKEKAEPKAHLDDLSQKSIEAFLKSAKLDVTVKSIKFHRIFAQLGLLEEKGDTFVPTGLGLLLFGEKPQLMYPNALIRATYKTAGRGEDIHTVEGALINQADEVMEWYENHIGKQIDRSKARHQTIYDYPANVIRECILNAIVHRDYDIEGAPVYFEINDEAIIIKSPGAPVAPLKMEQMEKFNAPSLSRNPRIMYIMEQMDLVEQRGLGFQTIKELSEVNLPLPFVSFDNPYMIFTFPREFDAFNQLVGNAELNSDELKGFDYIRIVQKITRKEYETQFGYDKKKAVRHLTHLTELGLIEQKGAGPGIYYESV